MAETRLINRFSEKVLIRGNGQFWVQKLHILIALDPLEEFFKILHNERAKKLMKIILRIFQKKISGGGGVGRGDKWTILGPTMVHSHNCGSTVRTFLKLWRMKGANRYMEILLVVFQEFDLFIFNPIFYWLIEHG